MNYLRTAVAITAIVVIPVAFVVVTDYLDGPSPDEHVVSMGTSAQLDDLVARNGGRIHPGQGRGPKTLPPPFTTTTTIAEESDTTHDHATTTTSVQPASTTSAARTPTTTESTGSTVSGTLSGDVCPCTVEGTVELKGTVNLKGDLMVMGGTLIARPGVTVNGNGYQIMFMSGGRADFQGSEVFTWSGTGSSQNLQRDINFVNMRRIMFHKGAGKSTLRYFTVRDSGSPAIGDYPIHWHLNGDSVRGTLVEGVVVVNGQHHAFVPHGSHGIYFKDTIAKNTRGEAYWWDPAGSNDCNRVGNSDCTTDNSNDITYDHALADGVFNGPGDTRGFQLNAFRLGAGSGNRVFDSVAINVKPSHNDVCSGFHWPADANHNKGGNVWLFKNNHATSSCNGIYVWQNDGNRHLVDGFTGGGIEHGAYGNNYEYRNVDVPFLLIHATGWSIRDSRVGTIEARDHRTDDLKDVVFTNVTGETIILNDSGGVSGVRLVFNGTNLTCGDVSWTNAHPQTRVIIDGDEC